MKVDNFFWAKYTKHGRLTNLRTVATRVARKKMAAERQPLHARLWWRGIGGQGYRFAKRGRVKVKQPTRRRTKT